MSVKTRPRASSREATARSDRGRARSPRRRSCAALETSLAVALRNLPAWIRVLAHDVPVRLADAAWDDQQRRCSGLFTGAGPGYGITLDADPVSAVALAETLLHELLHAMSWARGVDFGTEEEPLVTALGATLTQVLRDNPELRAWLDGALT